MGEAFYDSDKDFLFRTAQETTLAREEATKLIQEAPEFIVIATKLGPNHTVEMLEPLYVGNALRLLAMVDKTHAHIVDLIRRCQK